MRSHYAILRRLLADPPMADVVWAVDEHGVVVEATSMGPSHVQSDVDVVDVAAHGKDVVVVEDPAAAAAGTGGAPDEEDEWHVISCEYFYIGDDDVIMED